MEYFFLAEIDAGMRQLAFAISAFLAVGVGLTVMILITRAKFVSTELCTIEINDNPELIKRVPGGQTLLSALTSSGIPVPSPCGGKATCKQCRVQVIEEADPPLETDKATFTVRELKEGWRLSCQCKVKHDLHVLVDEHALSVKMWDCTVVSNENVATFIKELIVKAPEEIPYKSGGYLQVHVPPFKTQTEDWKATMEPQYHADWEKFKLFGRVIDFSSLPEEVIRAYSMASYPAEGTLLRFNIRIATPPFQNGEPIADIPWGICSSYTFGLKAGDTIKVSGPYGESFMKQDERQLIFLIGGAGSSFGRSHILQLFYTDKTKRDVTLWYGARSLKENIYQQEYEELARQFPNFHYNLVLSEPQPEDLAKGWPKDDPIKTAYLFKAFEEGQLKRLESPEECLYYVCGPPMHNKCVMQLLDNYGVPRNSIVLDDFGS